MTTPAATTPAASTTAVRTPAVTSPPAAAARGRRRGWTGLLLVPVLLAGCTGEQDAGPAREPSTATPPVARPAAAGPAQSLEDAYQQVITDVLPSVVEIRTPTGLGSGVVLDGAGNIVTNAHVVGTATAFEVRFANSATSYPATLVGTYPAEDLAVVHVEGAPDLRPATFGDSASVEVGTIVLAMGNPLGLSSSVSNGIVSAVGRTVTEPAGEGSPGATLPGTIQTSAAINPGNSGGALVDLRGSVIGIPTLAATDQQLGGAAPGIGFAIPADRARDITRQLVEDGRVLATGRAALGVRVTTLADAAGRPAGVGVVDVDPAGEAATAGLRRGDVIVSVAGQDVVGTSQLAVVLAGLRIGQSVDVVVERDGTASTVAVVLGELTAAG
ncbi:PDZ domain-containing protein [Kineococcus sp. R8]|uniref:S1C family serine protease n=1 Tax=Kineococcus siccus TaxID=2696567 RepID=UPI001412AEB7|nr:trypsin-like peptidase domain-containing protein [Kineococcus siccus]NAZ83848.1 PDZ domain-containing protein [Kineococcus siccus]